jgi:hypothetical protein
MEGFRGRLCCAYYKKYGMEDGLVQFADNLAATSDADVRTARGPRFLFIFSRSLRVNKSLKLTCAFCEIQLKPLEMGICRPCKEKNKHLRSWRRLS